ncbi:MAG: autotransporter-associated beta strand repeat-containing protein, partial [Verrucomicrobia bacterium]|nr:autotransporter-associated beta strand repeat-containing protein [Verrucomicrobiota bacterium]
MTIQSYQPGFSGNIYLNRGTLTLSEPAINASNATTNVGGVNGTIFMNGATTLLNLRSDSGNAVNGTTTFQNSVSLAPGSIMQRIDLNHLTLTNTNAREFILSNLTFGGTSGDQGQTLTVGTGANPTNNISLRIGGTTDLGPVGNAYFNLVSGGTNVTLAGSIIGNGTLVAEGNQATLFLGQNGVVPTTGWSTGGGLIVTTRTVQANVAPVTIGANSAIDTGKTYLGSGPITLAGGTLNISADSGADTTFRTYSFPAGNTVTVTGNTTIGANRITGAGTNKLLAFPSLNIGGQTLTSSSTNTHSIQFNAVNITGTPTFAVSNDLVVGTVKDNSAGLYVVKNGGGTLWFNDNTSSNSPVFVNQGLLRFGNPGAGSVTATAGTGAIQLNPLGAIRVDAPANVPTAGQVTSIGTTWSLPISRVGAALTQAQIVAYTNAASTNTQLRLDTANSNALNMAAIGDGSFILGSQGAVTYSGNTLDAGNQVTLGQNGYVAGATGGTYRLGSNDAAGTVFTLAPATATNTILTGVSNVVIGTLAVGGNNGTGTVLFNNTNNYTLGTTISRGSEGRIQTGTTNTPLGGGQVDVFGTLRAVNTNGSFIGSGTTNNNAIVMHPGSAIVLDGTGSANNANRWGDTNAVALNGSSFTMQTLTATAQNETVGAITYANGSRIGINNPGSPLTANILTSTGGLTRVGTGTLVFVPADPFGTNIGNTDNFVATTGLPATVFGVNMLPAYIISGAQAVVSPSFLTDAGGGSNRLIYTTYSAANFAGSTNTSIGDVTANTNLAGDTSVFAFRIGNFTVSNAPGQLNTITLNQSGVAGGGGILATATANINPNLNFNNQEALIYSHTGTLTLNGDISGVSSVGITKFGGGALAIGKDQTDAARGTGNGYNSGWTVNEGQLTPNTFGALGNAVSTNVVRLNASTAAGANANGITGAAVLRLAVNAGNPSLNYYTMGNLQVLDAATISYEPGANDRMSALGAAGSLSNIVVTSTGGNLNDAQLFLDTNRDRSMVVAGDLQIVADSGTAAGLQLRVHNSNFNGANSSGLSVNTLVGVADTRITKIGSGELYIRGNSTAFNGTLNIEQGAVGVFNNGSLGSATSVTNVRRYGVLDVQVASFVPTGTVNYQLGGIERWSVDGARTGTLNLGAGTLQVNNDQTANTLAVTMGGGSIEGYLRLDDNLTGGQGQAVYRTLNSNITFNLTADSFLGQNINQGLNGYDNGRQPVVFSTTGNSVVGAVLEIKGAITGTGGLTKQGYDTVTLSSASNNYSGQTNVVQGQLRAGVNNALPSSNIVSTTGGAVLDLNGYNLSIGRITSPASGFTASTFTPNLANSNPTGSGYITNSALDTTKTLSVGNGANGTSADFTFGGVIQYNIALEKNGAAVLNLTNANTYNGGTIINGGWLNAANTLAGTTGSATGTGPVSIETGATLAGAGTVAGIVTLKAGGTIQPGALTAGAVGTPTSQSGVLTLGGLTINGGTLVFNLDTPGSITDDEINLTGIGTGILNVTATPTITITNAGGFAAGLYKLIGFANGTVTGFGNLPVNPASPVGGLILTTVSNPFEVDLLVQANTTVKWTGAENQLWDLVNPHTAPKNWVDLTANPADFVDSLDVTFDDTATGFAPVVSGTIKPKSISFLNTTGFNYTLGTDGTGVIADDTAPTALTKLNTGGLTINIGTNTFTGGSTITAGTTTFGASTTVVTGAITQGPLGLGTIIARNSTLSDNGTAITLSNALNIDGNLTFATTGGGSLSFLADAGKVTTITNVASNTNLTVNTGTNTTINQAIGGSGKGITKLGTGTLTLGGNNGYNGGTTVTSGTLTLATTGNLASGSNLSVGSTAAAVNLNNTAAQTLGTLTADSAVNLNTATTTTITTLNGASTGVITQGTGTSNLSVNVGTYAGTILGTAAVTKTGGSGDTLTFTSAGSTYSNGTTLTGGIITVGASTVSGATITSGPIGTGTLAMAAGTSLNAQTADQTLANALTINGNISLGGTNDLTIDGTALTVPTNITLLATSQITTAAGLIESFNSVVTDGAGTFAITKAGTGQLNLNNVNNTYTGITTINAGVLGVTSLENQTAVAGTNADSLGNSSNIAANLVINGATLQYLGAGSTTDRQMTVGTSGAILDASGSGAVNFTNATAAGLTLSGTNTARTLTLQGSNTGSNILSALIANNGTGATAITKQGTGTWRLANTASTTTGITTLSGGVLEVTKLALGGSASSIGQSTNAVTNLIFNNGATLRWIGDGVVNNDTTDRLMTYASGNGVIDASPT